MALSDIRKTKAARTLGIDCSTKSLAYAVFDKKKPIHCGEIVFEGANLYERLADCHKKVPALVKAGVLKADYVAFEGAIITGKNAKVGLSLAYVYGAAMGGLMDAGMQVVNVGPIQWQNWIGNKRLNAAEKAEIVRASPGKSANWYLNANREFRKQRTLAFSRQFFPIASGSDNIGDAVAIAWYAVNNLTS